MAVSGDQIRAARGLLDWSRDDLAKASGVSAETVKRLERTQGPLSANVQTIDAIRAAFDRAGVVFIDQDEAGGPGVRFRQASDRSA